MVDTGSVVKKPIAPYCDYNSLNRYVHSRVGGHYSEAHAFHTNLTMLTTGTDDELEADDGIALSYIGRTEVTLVLSGDGDNASTTGKLYTFVYKDRDGVEHTTVGTGTATLNGTPVAFVPACSDFYCPVSFTASAADANVNVIALVAAGATHATISTTTTAATEAQLIGIGAVYGRSHTEHGDADSKVHYMEYLTGYGTVKYGHCTQTTTSVNEIRFFEGTYDISTDLVTATTTTVKDFYRVRRLWTLTTPTANSHEWILTDADCGNVDGSSGDIYGLILEGKYESIMTRYTCPVGYDAWVAKIDVAAAVSADADSYTFTQTWVNRYSAITHVCLWEFTYTLHKEDPILLDELTDVIFTINDLATADNISGDIVIMEAKLV